MKNKRTLILILAVTFIVFILSEILYAFKHKWILYSYMFDSAKLLNSIGLTNLGFRTATGFKYVLPNNKLLKDDISNDIKSTPDDYTLPVMLYYFALSSYSNGDVDMSIKLLNLSIKMDPDFSYWRVELANLYANMKDTKMVEQTLRDCMTLPSPKQHCQDYLNNYQASYKFQNVGYLKDMLKGEANRFAR